MARIRSKNTKPEMLLRRALRDAGLAGYRLHWGPYHVDVAWPDYLGVLVDAPAVRAERVVAVMAENPESWREVLVNDLLEKLVPRTSRLAVEAVDMIDCKKCRLTLTATDALRAVGFEDLAASSMVVRPGFGATLGYVPLVGPSILFGTTTGAARLAAVFSAAPILKRNTAFSAGARNWRSRFAASATTAVPGEPGTLPSTILNGGEIRYAWQDFGLAFGADLHDKSIVTCYPAARKVLKVAVFVDGAFWHWKSGKLPKTNTEFWRRKFTRSVERASEANRALRRGSWVVIRYWDTDKTMPVGRIRRAVNARRRAV